jgi:hypothetical protein
MERMNLSEEMKEELRMFVLNRASVRLFNQATHEYSVRRLYYYFKRELMSEYTELMISDLWFSVIMCDAFKPYQVNEVECIDRERKINQVMRLYKLYPKHHPEKARLAKEHNELVEMHNASIEPQNKLISIFRKIQRSKSKWQS